MVFICTCVVVVAGVHGCAWQTERDRQRSDRDPILKQAHKRRTGKLPMEEYFSLLGIRSAFYYDRVPHVSYRSTPPMLLVLSQHQSRQARMKEGDDPILKPI